MMSDADLRWQTTSYHREQRIERLIDRLPPRFGRATRWLRKPSSRWVRIPAGILLIAGGFLSILPVFGLWMFPLGLLLLGEDIPLFRRARDYVLDRLEQYRPHWFAPAAQRSIPYQSRSDEGR
jgi:hypothetical protein